MPGTKMSVVGFLVLLGWIVLVKYGADVAAGVLADKHPNKITKTIKAIVHS